MRLKHLSSERYTIWELLEYLGLEDHEWDEIYRHAVKGNIQIMAQHDGSKYDSAWFVVPPDEVINIGLEEFPGYEFTVAHEEAERFKKLYCYESATVENKTRTDKTISETDQQLCERLKAEGLESKVIAKELKRAFPEILPSRIGRFLPAHPGTSISPDAHRKRGERLLK